MKELFDRSITWELKHNVPFRAKANLIQTFTQQWPAPSNELFEEVFQDLSKSVDALLGEDFKSFKRLQARVR
jgi:hypothetical protein